MSRLTVLYVYLAILIFWSQNSFTEASFLNHYADSALTVWTVIGWVLLQTQSCLICWGKNETFTVTSVSTLNFHLFRQNSQTNCRLLCSAQALYFQLTYTTHQLSNIPALDPNRRTCIAMWPEHLVDLQKWNSHIAEWQKQTTLCISLYVEP